MPGLAAIVFSVLVVAVAVAIVFFTRAAALRGGAPPDRANRTAVIAAVGIAGWLAILAAMAGSGFLADFEARPPRTLFVLGGGTLLFAVVTRSGAVSRLLAAAPPTWAVAIQSMRVPVEISLWLLFCEG